MKKKLEADLISIAHRVLQMKNKSDIDQLYIETQKLYEKLAVLRFVETHFNDSKPTIGQAEIIEKIEQNTATVPVTEIQPEIVAEIAEDEVVSNEVLIEDVAIPETPEEIIEETETSVEATVEPIEVKEFLPAFELEELKETPTKSDIVQISFEELLGGNYDDTHFVKVDHNQASPLDFELPKVTPIQNERAEILTETKVSPKEIEPKTAAVLEKQISVINIGLNDRIAFVKHLFGNSNEEYNRVLNQLITFDNFEEAQDFIEDMVKPDYNNWEGKEDYSERFIQIIEKKFA